MSGDNQSQIGGGLQNQVFTGFGNALSNANSQFGQGAEAINAGSGLASQAASIYNNMAGVTPQNITAGMLGNTDLTKYLNPFTSSVTDSTMNELNRQEQIQKNNIASEATKQGAFGGDRFAIQLAQNNRDFDQTRASALANLNQANFNQAQNAATSDLNRQLTADQSNQSLGASQQAGGAAGLTGLANTVLGLGNTQQQSGISSLGNLANMGFGWGSDLENRQLASGALQTAQKQQLLDLINKQTSGFTNFGDTALGRYFGSVMSPGNSGTSTTTNDPGIAGIFGSLLGGIGALF